MALVIGVCDLLFLAGYRQSRLIQAEPTVENKAVIPICPARLCLSPEPRQRRLLPAHLLCWGMQDIYPVHPIARMALRWAGFPPLGVNCRQISRCGFLHPTAGIGPNVSYHICPSLLSSTSS